MNFESAFMNPQIFISYRIADTLQVADRLAAELQRHFSVDAVFFDRRSLESGEEWPTEIANAVENAAVVLVLIGKKWLTEQNQYGRRRLDLKGDWVRREVETALAGQATVIPLLVDGASPVPSEALEGLSGLEPLSTLQATPLRTWEWDNDFCALVQRLTRLGLPLLVVTDTTAPTQTSRTAAGPGFDLDAYREAMRKRYARLKLEELDPTTHDIRSLTLTGMFIAQSARECAEFLPRMYELPKEQQRRLCEAGEMEVCNLDAETLEEHRRAYLDQSPRPILEIVSDPTLNRLVVLGDPGSGKSTLLQYLLLQWAEQATPCTCQEGLPLLIELREYARLRQEGQADGFLNYLHGGAGLRWHLDQTQLDGWLRDNDSLVLFDGLDEVFDSTLRGEIATSIHRFADTYVRSRVIITSRIIGYQHQSWRDEGFRHFMLQELDKAQIEGFLHRWHEAAYEDPRQGETKRALIARAIADSTAIRQLAGNPLLLTMMAILNRTQDLPRDRAELYEQCARLLLHQWKVDLAFAPDPELAKASLDFKDKRGLLQRVARAIQTNAGGLGANLIDEDALERTLAEGLAGVPNLRPERAGRALIEQLRGRNFMLCSVGGRSYAFVHRTFLEYFCAVDIRERFQTEQSLTFSQLLTDIYGHWGDEAWHEVLSLLSGMLAPRFVNEILEWLLAQSGESNSFRNVLLAVRCVSEVRQQTALNNLVDKVRNQAMDLVQLDLHDTNIDKSEINKINYNAFKSICNNWIHLNETRLFLSECIKSHPFPPIRMFAVTELLTKWKTHPETFDIIKLQALSDSESAVRMFAHQIITEIWENDQRTNAMLTSMALSDKDRNIRFLSMASLVKKWKHIPETIHTIENLSLHDKENTIRIAAINFLAENWINCHTTENILIDRSQFDEDELVRNRAKNLLAQK